jgi:hypothetical protein
MQEGKAEKALESIRNMLSAEARGLLGLVFAKPPETLAGDHQPAARELEAFHRDRIAAHLERDLRAPRVIREISREGAR